VRPATNRIFFSRSCKSLFQLGHPLGLVVEKPTTVPLSSDHYDEYRKEIEDKVNPKVNFVVVLLPTKMKQRYDVVKKTLSLTCPVVSQCVVTK